MKLFFFDTETTGLCPGEDRVIQFGGITGILDEKTFAFTETNRINQLINTNVRITPMATAVHGLKNEDLADYDYMDAYLPSFLEYINDADYVVGHNISFDANMIIGECRLNNIEFHPEKIEWVDTMRPTTYLVNGRGGRWPKLSALHYFLFGCNFENAHDAMADIEATKNCFIELCSKYHFYENGKFKTMI